MRFKLISIFALICFLGLPIFAGIQKTLTVDKEGEAIVKIFVSCEYTILLKEPKNKEIKIYVSQMGNGFFAGEHRGNNELIISAAHVFLCNSTIGNLESNGIFKEYDGVYDENVTTQNIIAIKKSEVAGIFAYTFEGVGLEDIKKIFISPEPSLLDAPDNAIFSVRLPENTNHEHILLMDDKLFDDIFYKNGIKKSVYVRGFLNYQGGWFLRFKDAEIEWIGENAFQINELLDKGISGSPVIFEYNGINYVIGVASKAPIEIETPGRAFDFSWISIVKKNFLNIKEQKK